MADIPFDIPRLTAIRNAVIRSPEVAGVSLVNFPAEAPDGEFRVTLNDGTVIQVDMTIISRKPAAGEDNHDA